jgi:hypothetical protein
MSHSPAILVTHPDMVKLVKPYILDIGLKARRHRFNSCLGEVSILVLLDISLKENYI